MRPPAFYPMVSEDLGRSRRWAEQLMSIARNAALTDAKHVSQLPADTQSLYQLSRLPAEVIEANIETGAISPDLSRVGVVVAARGGEDSGDYQEAGVAHSGSHAGSRKGSPPNVGVSRSPGEVQTVPESAR